MGRIICFANSFSLFFVYRICSANLSFDTSTSQRLLPWSLKGSTPKCRIEQNFIKQRLCEGNLKSSNLTIFYCYMNKLMINIIIDLDVFLCSTVHHLEGFGEPTIPGWAFTKLVQCDGELQRRQSKILLVLWDYMNSFMENMVKIVDLS